MRRNAESLLVLAGAEASRQWSGPVRVTDVVRAALGEVEDYRRVAIHDVEAATVLGSVAADLAHLLAELIENALRFSPPDRLVEVTGRAREGRYLVLVSDDGLGMSRDDLNAANRRLSRAEGFSVASSRFLGHYVAGNLAARHGITVRLHQPPCSGITAAVELPPSVFVTGRSAVAGSRVGLPSPPPPRRAPLPPRPPRLPQPPRPSAPAPDVPVAARGPATAPAQASMRSGSPNAGNSSG
jgi:anti-sigma regulatory factor (Ser/Thr protein kinase)